MRLLLGGIGLLLLAGAPGAMAQGHPAHGPAYAAPRHGRPVVSGRHCRTRIVTRYGVAPLVCPIVRPKAIGQACACPPPGAGPFLRGRTVR